VSGDDAPWWASDADPEAGLRDDDPVAAHRAGRRGHGAADDGPRAWWEEIAGVLTGAGHGHADDPGARSRCHICRGIDALESAGPEVVEHLSEAARHLGLAAKAFVDAAAETMDTPRDGAERGDIGDE